MIINEGMRESDLIGLVLRTISYDEYESRINDDAIVLGFYVKDNEAVKDLSRFIQRTPIDILDVEVSPAPDQKGYYICFVELLNDNQLKKNIKRLLKEISLLTKIDVWKLRKRKS